MSISLASSARSISFVKKRAPVHRPQRHIRRACRLPFGCAPAQQAGARLRADQLRDTARLPERERRSARADARGSHGTLTRRLDLRSEESDSPRPTP